MQEREIDSLIRLLDDPDRGIAEQVEERLLYHGSGAITKLEKAWEHSFDSMLQEKLENLIHKIQFNDVRHELELWKIGASYDLLKGFLIINKYQFPDLDDQKIINQLEDIKREVWMKLHNDSSDLERIETMNYVFYNVFGFSGNTKNYQDPANSYISQVLETRKGNQISLAVIYSIIAQKLDIPVYGVNLPQHFILAYVDESLPEGQQVMFYINAFNKGYTFGRRDIFSFLRQLNLRPDEMYFNPCSNIDIMKRILRNLSSSYQKAGQEEKMAEITILLDILNDE